MIRSYSDLINIETFEARFDYLKLIGSVGHATFGFDRFINQHFYTSRDWKRIRSIVIIRDSHGRSEPYDMSFTGYPIGGTIHVHHMNPITIDDIQNGSDFLLNPEFLVCVSHRTHNAIHFGDKTLLPRDPIERIRGDTTLW